MFQEKCLNAKKLILEYVFKCLICKRLLTNRRRACQRPFFKADFINIYEIYRARFTIYIGSMILEYVFKCLICKRLLTNRRQARRRPFFKAVFIKLYET